MPHDGRGVVVMGRADLLREHEALRMRVIDGDHADDCAYNCDEDGAGPCTSLGPCGVGSHFKGKVHVACSCGLLDEYRRVGAALGVRS
jgi:hypothetical protein